MTYDNTVTVLLLLYFVNSKNNPLLAQTISHHSSRNYDQDDYDKGSP